MLIIIHYQKNAKTKFIDNMILKWKWVGIIKKWMFVYMLITVSTIKLICGVLVGENPGE